MRLKTQYKVREMAGEHVVIMQGRLGSDLTRIISLNESALLLWTAVEGKEFSVEDAAAVLVEHYGIADSQAVSDVERWVNKLDSCGLIEG